MLVVVVVILPCLDDAVLFVDVAEGGADVLQRARDDCLIGLRLVQCDHSAKFFLAARDRNGGQLNDLFVIVAESLSVLARGNAQVNEASVVDAEHIREDLVDGRFVGVENEKVVCGNEVVSSVHDRVEAVLVPKRQLAEAVY